MTNFREPLLRVITVLSKNQLFYRTPMIAREFLSISAKVFFLKKFMFPKRGMNYLWYHQMGEHPKKYKNHCSSW